MDGGSSTEEVNVPLTQEEDTMDDPSTGTANPIQLASTLKIFSELRQSKALTDADYERVKVSILAAVERHIIPPPVSPTTPPPVTAPAAPKEIQEFAGDLHRMISEKLAKEYPSGEHSEQKLKRYLTDVAAALVASRALHPADMPRITSVIQTVVDTSYASSLQR